MTGSIIAWIVAAVAVCGAAFLLAKWRGERARSLEAESEASLLKGNLRAEQKRSGARSAGDRRRDDEVAELRRKLDKAKKRASQARTEQLAESHRIKELEERLRLRDAGVRAARSGADREPIVVAPRPAAPKPASPAPAVDAPAPKLVESEALAAASKRAAHAEAECEQTRGRLAELELQVKRLQGKTKTQDKLYSSMRLELEAKKDRLGAQQEELERLRAMKVALMEPAAEAVSPPLASGDPLAAAPSE